jgi:prepilin-type processing-associated H-X9-DG protein
VIAIIGILVSLLLPAVQAAREAARRSQCINNEKQIGLALLNFESTYKIFPAPVSTTARATNPMKQKFSNIGDTTDHGWQTFILPFMEQQPLYDRYDWTVRWRDTPNRAVVGTRIPAFECPSTPDSGALVRGTGALAFDMGPCDYGVNNAIGSGTGATNTLFVLGVIDQNTANSPTSMMRVNEVAGIAQMLDGTSNTSFIHEDAGRPQQWLTGRRKGTSTNVSGMGWANRDNEYITHGFATTGLTNPGPCPINCTNSNETYGFHPGGVVNLFADGSVRFIAQTINMRVWGRLLTRGAGDIYTDQ